MGVVHRQQKVTRVMHLCQDIRAKMPGEPIDNEIATISTQECLWRNGGNLTRRGHSGQQEAIVIYATRQERRCNFPLESVLIPPQCCPRNTLGQILLPRDEDQTMHRICSNSTPCL